MSTSAGIDQQAKEVKLSHAAMKLGKAPKRHDPRTLKLARYLDLTSLPAIPPSTDWSDHVPSWGTMLNDKYGDCTCAGVGHLIQLDTSVKGKPVILPDEEILRLYETVTGQEGAAFDPSTGMNDNGCVELDVLNYWRQNGVCGHRIGAYASVDPGHLDHLRATIAFFSCAYVGVQLPISAQSQDVWDVSDASLHGDAAPGSWGGHCVILTDYDTAAQRFTCVTWGQKKYMTFAWWKAYSDEAYAILSDDWVTGDSPAPCGLHLEQLQADLALI